MKLEHKIALLEHWINESDILGRKIPPELKDYVSEGEATRFHHEIPFKETGRPRISDLVQYKFQLKEDFDREQRRVHDQKFIKLQEKVTVSQYIIATIMIITAIITGVGLWFSFQTYNLQFEDTRPSIALFRSCQNFSNNGSLNITVTIRNTGQLPASISFDIVTDTISLETVAEDGILIETINGTKVGRKQFFIDGESRQQFPILMNISRVTVPEFTVQFTAHCFTKDCRFFESRNYGECKYFRQATGYSLSPESTCIVQPENKCVLPV